MHSLCELMSQVTQPKSYIMFYFEGVLWNGLQCYYIQTEKGTCWQRDKLNVSLDIYDPKDPTISDLYHDHSDSGSEIRPKILRTSVPVFSIYCCIVASALSCDRGPRSVARPPKQQGCAMDLYIYIRGFARNQDGQWTILAVPVTGHLQNGHRNQRCVSGREDAQ